MKVSQFEPQFAQSSAEVFLHPVVTKESVLVGYVYLVQVSLIFETTHMYVSLVNVNFLNYQFLNCLSIITVAFF